MRVPEGYTLEETLAIIDRVARMLCSSFVFGVNDLDDVLQEARIFAIKLLEKGRYEPGRPLEKYICTHLKRRLLNYQRDHLRRSDAPCMRCHREGPCQDAGEGKACCERYRKWLARNNAKANLQRPLGFDHVPEASEEPEDGLAVRETLERIDERLPVELRADYLAMRAGVSLPKARREAVVGAVREIIDDHP